MRMSTELGQMDDAINADVKITIGIGTMGVQLFSAQNKIWSSPEEAERLADILLMAASKARKKEET